MIFTIFVSYQFCNVPFNKIKISCEARFILPANAIANLTWIWRHNPPFAAIFASELSRAQLSANFVANLWRQHSYRIRIRRKYEPGFRVVIHVVLIRSYYIQCFIYRFLKAPINFVYGRIYTDICQVFAVWNPFVFLKYPVRVYNTRSCWAFKSHCMKFTLQQTLSNNK